MAFCQIRIWTAQTGSGMDLCPTGTLHWLTNAPSFHQFVHPLTLVRCLNWFQNSDATIWTRLQVQFGVTPKLSWNEITPRESITSTWQHIMMPSNSFLDRPFNMSRYSWETNIASHELETSNTYRRGAYVTGQPGIGESYRHTLDLNFILMLHTSRENAFPHIYTGRTSWAATSCYMAVCDRPPILCAV